MPPMCENVCVLLMIVLDVSNLRTRFTNRESILKLLYGTDKNSTDIDVQVAQYFAKKIAITNQYDHRFSASGIKICDKDNPPFLLIMCLSLPSNVNTRHVIRTTWASVIQSNHWPTDRKLTINEVKLVFVFGETNSGADHNIINREAILYGDVIKADFVDTYKNLTRKVVVGMRWALHYCPGFQYLMKTDEDTFVNVRNALVYLKSVDQSQDVIIGNSIPSPVVERAGKWRISEEEYPFNRYPNYVSGQTYIISGGLVPKLVHTARHLPYIHLEDVFITGIVRIVAGGKYVDERGRFSFQFDKIPRMCKFFKSFKISATNINNRYKLAIWRELQKGQRQCR